MQQRTLAEGFRVSELGLGCMGMSEFYGPADDNTSMVVLQEAVEQGITFFDTADMYGPYHNEELLGQFLAQSKPQVKIATKFGIRRRPGEYARTIDSSPEHARKACEASLGRLGVERIDLYYVHRINPAQNIEETMGALSRLVEEGKVDRIGLCEVSAATLCRAHAVHPVTAVQTEYSLWSREVEAEVLPACRKLGIGFVPYSPLGRGFLTGRYQDAAPTGEGDFRTSLPRFHGDALSRNRRIVEGVRAMATSKGCSPGQLALAWLLAQGPDIVPIPGTKRSSYLAENIGAVKVSLSDQDMQQLNDSLAAAPVSGARYTQEGMKGVDV